MASGAPLPCGTRTSYHGDFSGRHHLGTRPPVAAAHGLRCPTACGILLDQDRTRVLCVDRWTLYSFLKIYLFKLEDSYFTKLWWFLPHIDMNQPWVVHVSRTPLPPPSPSPPSGSSQCPGFESPVLCIELGLVIYFTYDNIHVSVLFSQVIPPSPSPTESKSLFFITVSLLLSHI